MLNTLFSEARLSRYRNTLTESEALVLEKYLWNIQLSEALYPTLALVEVLLRNRLNEALSQQIGKEWLSDYGTWVPSSAQAYYKKCLAEARKACEKRKKASPSTNDLISELTLGFWLALFQSRYNQRLWNKPKVLDTVFPQLVSFYKGTNRPQLIRQRLEQLRLLRNRIAHHEAIFDVQGGLDSWHQGLTDFLDWLSPEATQWRSKLDRFPQVWQKQPLFLEEVSLH